jgi:monoterpene epsilon-lactone hydrolase
VKKTIIQGRASHVLRSLAVSAGVAAKVAIRRALGRRLVAQWPCLVEYGTLYMRAQFNHAFRLSDDIAASRAYFDSLYVVLETFPDVVVRPTAQGEPRGHWFEPKVRRSDATLLHFHGGGYTFYAGVSHHFAACLAHELGVVVLAPDYRLTPEHPHPAQLQDGLSAYSFLIDSGVDSGKIVLCGDSAGGHLALMALSKLREAGLPLPLLTLGLSPWTDVGRRARASSATTPMTSCRGT